ncbi:MAG: CpsD/CapB family tyrosine-protein kinase [Anaerolineae bacterium]|nr:CpsD/CapB family tyrosine-protein kinase [Anaerolineae bacterium]
MTANLITLTSPRSPSAEAYRTLRTNLLFSSVDRALHTLVVSAPTADADKSVTAANLAVTMAQGGRRTILADCDLRRPEQHTLWGVDNTRGLTAMMLEDDALQAPPLLDTGVAGLCLLPGGDIPPNPADLLGSKRMEAVIDALKAQADIVIFDTPPILAVTDAVLLGAKVDGALLVVRAGRTRRDDAARAKAALERVQVRLVGVVLSNAPRGASGSY